MGFINIPRCEERESPQGHENVFILVPLAADILGVSGKVPGAPHVEHAFTHHHLDSVAVPGPPVVSGEWWESGLWKMGWVKEEGDNMGGGKGQLEVWLGVLL